MNNFLEWYTYTNMGIAISGLLFAFFTFVVIYRLYRAFFNYVYTGTFGDHERSMFGQMMECNGMAAMTKYAMIGFHPLMVMVDVLFFVLIALLAQPFWAVYIVAGLIVLLAKVMRKRIAHKQKFISNLRGEEA